MISLSRATYCWLATNHGIIASVAKEHMSETAKKRVETLLNRPLNFPEVDPASYEKVGITPQNLATLLSPIEMASMWADVINHYTWRDPLLHDALSSMHYLPITFDLATPDAWRDNDQIRRHILRAIQNNPNNIVDGICSMIKTFTHPAASEDVQAIALRFLIHFMEDICQPLHAFNPIYREQTAPRRTVQTFGGNRIYFVKDDTPYGLFVTGPDPDKDVKREYLSDMHVYFDAQLGVCPQLPFPENSIYERQGLDLWGKNQSEYLQYLSDKARSLQVDYDFTIPQPIEWILQTYIAGHEIFVLQKSLRYELALKEGHITATFQKGQRAFQQRNTPILQQLSFKAGIRLAKLLTALTDPPNADSRYLFLIQQQKNNPTIPLLLMQPQLRGS